MKRASVLNFAIDELGRAGEQARRKAALKSRELGCTLTTARSVFETHRGGTLCTSTVDRGRAYAFEIGKTLLFAINQRMLLRLPNTPQSAA